MYIVWLYIHACSLGMFISHSTCVEVRGHPWVLVITFYTDTVLFSTTYTKLAGPESSAILSLPHISLEEHWEHLLPCLALQGFWWSTQSSCWQHKVFYRDISPVLTTKSCIFKMIEPNLHYLIFPLCLVFKPRSKCIGSLSIKYQREKDKSPNLPIKKNNNNKCSETCHQQNSIKLSDNSKWLWLKCKNYPAIKFHYPLPLLILLLLLSLDSIHILVDHKVDLRHFFFFIIYS